MVSPLLTETFGRLHDTKVVYEVKLYPTEVICLPQEHRTKQYTISLSSVIGCRCMRANSGADNRSFLTIYAYPKSSSGIRRRQTYTFFYEKTADYEKNFAVMRKWKLAISYIVSLRTPDYSVLESYLNGDIETLPIPERRWLVLLNPFSGRKNTEKVFSTLISGMFAEAEVDYTVIKTEYAGHARDFIRQAQLNSFNGIITSSGDGLVYEVINGLLVRPDWQEAIRTPLGVLPTGSGNAMSAMLCHIAGERVDRQHALHAAYLLVRPVNLPTLSNSFDLMAIDTIDGRLYSFLSVTWGIIADVDIESEKYRFMGGARFIVGTVARIVNLRTYRGRISFLPVDASEAKQTMQARRLRSVSSPSKRSSLSGVPQSVVSDDGQRHTLNGHDAIDYPNVGRYKSVDDLTTSKGVMKSASSASSLVPSTPLSSASKNPLPGNNDSRSPSRANIANNSFVAQAATSIDFHDQQDDVVNTSNGSAELNHSSTTPQRSPLIETPLLPKLSDPVPLNWVSIEDAFVGVVAMRCSHLSYDTVINPLIRPDDGAIWLMLTRAPVTRQTLIRQFLAMGRAERIDNDPSYEIECYRVHAFRIEPVPPSPASRILTVDGERVSYGPIQAQILPGIAHLI